MTFSVQHLEQLLVERRFGEVIAICDDFLSHAHGSAIVPQVHALMLKGTALRRYGPAWTAHAMSTYREALNLLGQRELALRARNLADLMAVYTATPDLSGYRPLLEEFLALCELCPEGNQWRWYVHYNHGVTAMNAMDPNAAVMAFQQALNTGAPSADLAAITAHNLAYAHLLLGDLDAVAELIDEVQKLLPTNRGASAANTLARFHLVRGDVSAATRTVENGLSHPDLDLHTEAALQLTRAMIARSTGDEAEACRLAMTALDTAYQGVNWGVLHEAHHFIAKGVASS